jgi:hypothetical protein
VSAAFASSGFSTQAFSVQAFAFDTQEQPKGGSGYSDWDQRYASAMQLARRDQQDLLDIVSILGLIAAQLDEF